MTEVIAIVDANDKVLGGEERQLARTQGKIHRIVRVLIRNSRGQILTQQRSAARADHPLKWEWSASGHVQAGEDYAPAASREASEEIGIHTPLTYIGKFYSEEAISPHMTLKRYNAVFTGLSDAPVQIDPEEVAATRWISPNDLEHWIQTSPGDFTPSFIEGFGKFKSAILALQD